MKDRYKKGDLVTWSFCGHYKKHGIVIELSPNGISVHCIIYWFKSMQKEVIHIENPNLKYTTRER